MRDAGARRASEVRREVVKQRWDHQREQHDEQHLHRVFNGHGRAAVTRRSEWRPPASDAGGLGYRRAVSRPAAALVGPGKWGRHILRDLVALGAETIVVDRTGDNRDIALAAGA